MTDPCNWNIYLLAVIYPPNQPFMLVNISVPWIQWVNEGNQKTRLAKEQGSMLTVTAILVLDFQAHAGEGDMGTVNGVLTRPFVCVCVCARVCVCVCVGRLWAVCGDKG